MFDEGHTRLHRLIQDRINPPLRGHIASPRDGSENTGRLPCNPYVVELVPEIEIIPCRGA